MNKTPSPEKLIKLQKKKEKVPGVPIMYICGLAAEIAFHSRVLSISAARH